MTSESNDRVANLISACFAGGGLKADIVCNGPNDVGALKSWLKGPLVTVIVRAVTDIDGLAILFGLSYV